MRIAIHGKFFDQKYCTFIQHIFNSLHENQIEVHVSDDFVNILGDTVVDPGDVKLYHNGDDVSSIDCFLSIGGDGTFLDTITYTRHYNVPILGINTGRLGFLASTTQNTFDEAIKSIYQRSYSVEERSLIHLDSSGDLFGDLNFGLNEFAILKQDTSSMIVVHTYINDEYLNSYWADGLIVSTPTGSTGYSLSCGGPFIHPLSSNFVITPVSAHNLNIRPMVVPDDCTISFQVEGRGESFMASLDSRSATFDSSVALSIRKENFKAKLLKLDGLSFYDTLRQKLHWGLDARN